MINYKEEKDRSSKGANQLNEIHLVNEKFNIVLGECEHTAEENTHNSIEIYKIKELRKFAASSLLAAFGENRS